MTTTPTNPVVEILIDGQWVDVAADVRLESAESGGGIHIKRGRPNESPAAEPTELAFTLNNGASKVESTLGQTGCYSPQNPNGPYYGKLTKNLPVRVGLDRVRDDFDRASANDWWGATPDWVDTERATRSGHQWNLFGTASNYDLTGSAATIQAASGYQTATFGTYADVDITTKVRVSNRTTEFGIVLRQENVQPEQADGSFEDGLGPWQVFDGTTTLVRSTAQSRFGAASALMTVSGSPSNSYMRPQNGSDASVMEGEDYKIRCWVRLSVTGDVYLSWDWYDDDLNYVDSSYSGGIAVTADTWFVVEYTATCPAGATRGFYGPGFDFTPANGTTMYVDNLHYQHVSNPRHFTAAVLPGTPDSIRIGITSGGSTTVLSSNLSFTLAVDTDYWIRAQAGGPRMRMKIWADGGDEPKGWMRTFVDSRPPTRVDLPMYGEVGLFARNGDALVTFDSIQVDQWRAHAEIVKLPTRFDLARVDHWVPVEARGLRRRLGQGRKELQSAVTRHLSSYTGSGMWLQLEEGGTETRVPNAADGAPEGIVSGISFSSPDSTGEFALPGVAGYAHLDSETSYVSAVAPYRGVTGAWTVLCFFRLPGPPASSETNLLAYYGTGTCRTARMFLQSDNAVRVEMVGADGTILDSDSALLWDFTGVPIGSWIACTLYVYQDGANVVWAWNYHRPGNIDAGFFTLNGSFAGSVGRFRQFRANNHPLAHAAGGLSIAQVFHYPGDLPFVTSAFARAAAAYDQEISVTRWVRLLNEIGVKGSQYNPVGGVLMGPQLPAPLLDLLDECAEAEHGAVIEDRADLALDLYCRPMAYRYTPLELDIDAGHLVEPLDATPDDQGLRNDVTVKNRSGFFARAVQTEGPNNINQPEDDPDGVGIYDEAPEINLGEVSDLQPAANWRKEHGVLTDPRYPGISADFTSTAYQMDPALAAFAASIDTGRMLRVINPEVSASPTDVLVQSYTEFIDQYDWDITWVGTPGRIETHIGTVDYTTRVSPANATVQAEFESGTDTSLMSEGTLWVPTSTDSAVADFDIEVDGVVLRVVSISGASAPQTITVEQTPVNGIVKTIAVGSRIMLYQPWRIGW